MTRYLSGLCVVALIVTICVRLGRRAMSWGRRSWSHRSRPGTPSAPAPAATQAPAAATAKTWRDDDDLLPIAEAEEAWW